MPGIARKNIRSARLRILRRIDGGLVTVMHGSMPLDSVHKIRERARRLYASHRAAFMELLLDIEPGVSVLEYYEEGKWTKDLGAVRILKHQRRVGC